MFAVAAILLLLGAWALVVCLLDWDPSLGVFDLQALGDALGPRHCAQQVVGGTGVAFLLAGLLTAF